MHDLTSEADSRSSIKKTPHFLWNPEVHYSIQNSPPTASILRHMHPVNIFPHYFHKIHSNIILHLYLKYSPYSSPFMKTEGPLPPLDRILSQFNLVHTTTH